MSDPGARPWWADVQHLRPAEDREREQRTRDTRDAALEHVRATPDGTRVDDGRPTSGARSRFARAAGAVGGVATLERATGPGREAPARGLADEPSSPDAFDDELASWLDGPPARREREIELVVETPLPVAGPAPTPSREDRSAIDDRAAASRREDRFTTDDWLALTATPEYTDPDTGRRTVEIRGQVDGVRGVARADAAAAATTAGAAPSRRRAPRSGRPVEHIYGRPDRVAMWAFVLGIVLILVALIGTPEAGAATRLGDRALKAGMEGRDVRHLQLRLKRAGFLDAPATARFGALTKRAVRRYQRSRCLKADGIAGPATIRALRARQRPCRRGATRSTSSRRTYRSVDLGARTLAKGMRGRDVRTLQSLLGLGIDGVFGNQTKRAVRRFQRRAGLTADGAVGPATRAALAQKRMRTRIATWYGPGLYGNRTACGQKLTRRLKGVAHRKLPCGTRVLLHHGGRFVTAKVVDRGPYANGATFDLTSATARQIGLRATERINARY